MELYDEKDFYTNGGSPTEHFRYAGFAFYMNGEDEENYGKDYDIFALVDNSKYPYIRLSRKRGNSQSPCGNSSVVATDGWFARLSTEERDKYCPKVAWGIACIFIIDLIYSHEQDDYVSKTQPDFLYTNYYIKYKELYFSSHNGLKYSSISDVDMELNFISDQIVRETDYWRKSQKLESYKQLYNYASDFVKGYISFIQKKRISLLRTNSKNNLEYHIEVGSAFGKSYLKLFLADQEMTDETKSFLCQLRCVKNINITKSNSKEQEGDSLTIYPKPMYSIERFKNEITQALDSYQSNVIVGSFVSKAETHFKNLRYNVISQLSKARATIDVCMAWLTDKQICDILLEKKKVGVKVRIIVNDDGINDKYGIDLSQFEHKKVHGERSGIMHRKFCVIDNATVILGSYNWTYNAEHKNDENIEILINKLKTASDYTIEFNRMWDLFDDATEQQDERMRKKLEYSRR